MKPRITFQEGDQIEEAQINACGGEVCSQTYPDGLIVHRIFLKDKDIPGIARTFECECVKSEGVYAEADVDEINIDLEEKPFMILASDGVWQFMASDFAVKAVAPKLPVDGSFATQKKVTNEAQKKMEEKGT